MSSSATNSSMLDQNTYIHNDFPGNKKWLKFVITIMVMLIVICVAMIFDGLYIVTQTQYALVTQFGSVESIKMTPGLKIKIPFIQRVIFFDNRLQSINLDSGGEFIAANQKTMRIEAFAKYKMMNPLQFYQTVHNENLLRQRLGSIISSTIREVVGSNDFIDVLQGKRGEMMEKITQLSAEQSKQFGVNVIDVRITQLALPDKTQSSVYGRMRTAREQEATEIRSKGEEEALMIRANADKRKMIILAEAERDANTIKGKADAIATSIYSQAFGADKDFADFYLLMEAYPNALQSDTTTFLMSQEGQFMKYLRGYGGDHK